MSERRKYRKFSQQHKFELVLASLRRGRGVAELCGPQSALVRQIRAKRLPPAGRRPRIGHAGLGLRILGRLPVLQ